MAKVPIWPKSQISKIEHDGIQMVRNFILEISKDRDLTIPHISYHKIQYREFVIMAGLWPDYDRIMAVAQ
jgi:hypothetical protein